MEGSEATTGFSHIALTAANATGYADSGLSAGTTYYHRVRATNAVGDSAYSNTATATTPGTRPAALSGLGAAALASSQVRLAWSDNASNEARFKIKRKTGAGTYSQVVAVGANVTNHVDTTCLPHTTYSYRVYAWNAGGNSGCVRPHIAAVPVSKRPGAIHACASLMSPEEGQALPEESFRKLSRWPDRYATGRLQEGLSAPLPN